MHASPAREDFASSKAGSQKPEPLCYVSNTLRRRPELVVGIDQAWPPALAYVDIRWTVASRLPVSGNEDRILSADRSQRLEQPSPDILSRRLRSSSDDTSVRSSTSSVKS